MIRLMNSGIVAAIIFAAWSDPARAYIDPGAGSLILQGIIGGVAGGLFILRAYWVKVVAFISGASGRAAPDVATEIEPARQDR
ncbi:MAG: hypothetical protein A3E78_06065 [Alphaproteobacteria bacterium RIFCSPHIGHO2_12_FULL_63_12]|nr:MAG: hypothetical protein A3E78_06065 [Alphaproteobacteria bacterium RIFCSPHIGHO2_12_FULL_63_12]